MRSRPTCVWGEECRAHEQYLKGEGYDSHTYEQYLRGEGFFVVQMSSTSRKKDVFPCTCVVFEGGREMCST